MSINLTLLGQMITFLVFVWFTMRYIWPPITKAMHDRQKQIADGLAAGERGKRELELAEHKSVELLRETKLTASHLIEQANKRALQIIEESKEEARQQSQQILAHAQAEVKNLVLAAKADLSKTLSGLVIMGAEKILEKEVDQKSHEKMFEALVTQL